MAAPDLVRTRDRLAGAGAATGLRAPFDAVEEAVEALGRDPGLVLIFPTGDLDPQETAMQAHAAAGEARVAGMTGTGVITPGGAIESGCSAIAFDASVPVGIGTAPSADPRAAGRTAAAEALVDVDREGSHVALLLFVDSESGDQAEIVDGAYEIAGGRIPLAGEPPAARREPSSRTAGRCREASSLSPSPAGSQSVSAFPTAVCLVARRRSSPDRTDASCSNSTVGPPKLSTSRRSACGTSR